MHKPLADGQAACGRGERLEDACLVRDMIENRPDAWREFRRRYDLLVLRCITNVTRRFGWVSSEDVRDIYGLSMLSLLTNDMAKLRGFDPARGNRLSTWVGMLAIHTAYDHLRKLRREPHKVSLKKAEQILAEAPDPFDDLLQKEYADIASEVFAGFSEKDQTFAALYFGEELEPEMIAARLNISVKTVYTKKHKIRLRLEALLGQKAA